MKYPPFQCVPRGTLVGTHSLCPTLTRRSAPSAVLGAAALRQMQAISNMLRLVTGFPLDNFDADVNVEPVQPGQIRVLMPNGSRRQVAFVLTEERAVVYKVLPEAERTYPLCVLGVDPASIACAGIAFCQNELSKLVWTAYDKFHHLIRDINQESPSTLLGKLLLSVFPKELLVCLSVCLDPGPFGKDTFFS